jgi:hypothetical protein
MPAFIKIYILNYIIHHAGMHVIPKPCHTQNNHKYVCNNFWILALWTQTYPKGALVNLYNHRNRVIILLAKEYKFVYTLNIWTWDNKQFKSRAPESSYITSHCICTLVLHMYMYVHMPVTVLTHWKWPFKSWNVGVLITTTGNFPQTLCFCSLIHKKM